MSTTRAVILAAGRGRRMKGLTADRPKCLLPVGGRPLLASAIDSLRAGGIEEIGIVTGYRAELLAWPEIDRRFHNAEWETTNMIRSLVQAREWLVGRPCLVCYSDIQFGAATIRALASASGDLVVANNLRWRAVWEKRFADPLEDAETFRRDASGRLVDIGRRPSSFDEVQGQFMGLLRITPAGFTEIEDALVALPAERRRTIDVTSLLGEMIRRGVHIDTVDTDEDWWEYDSEQDLERRA